MKVFTDVQMQQSARNAEPVRAETDKLKLDAANEKLAKIYDSKRRKRIQNNTPKERISTEGKEGLHSKGVPKSTIREKSFEWINDEVTGMLPNLLYHATAVAARQCSLSAISSERSRASTAWTVFFPRSPRNLTRTYRRRSAWWGI